MSRFSERRWSILPNSSISDVDFSQVLEVNSEHVITNVSGSLSVVKWDGSSVMPASVKAIEGHEEILTVIAGREWISPDTEQ